MSQVKKISVATVFGKIDLKELLAAPAETIKVMRVLGSAVGVKEGESNFGHWKALMGQFRASHPETGEVFEAPILFLPEVALTPILVSLTQPGARAVEFALELSVKYVNNSKPGGVPYEYTWAPLLAPDADDPIARLEARIAATAQAALPSPTGDGGDGKQATANAAAAGAKSSKK